MEQKKIPGNLQNKLLKKGKTLFLFDVDGTLVDPKLEIKDFMLEILNNLYLRPDVDIGLVSCGDLKNLTRELKTGIKFFKYLYTENGVVTYDNNLNLLHKKSMKELLGEEKYNNLKKFLLDYIEKVEIPFKVGNYLDERSAVINVCPCGNPVTMEQREEFRKWDLEHNTVETFRKICEDKFSKEYGLRFTKGGLKSFDIFPVGWDKTYCLQFISGYDNILFFGDNTYVGGADYDLAIHELVTKGINVLNPEDCAQKIKKLVAELDALK